MMVKNLVFEPFKSSVLEVQAYEESVNSFDEEHC